MKDDLERLVLQREAELGIAWGKNERIQLAVRAVKSSLWGEILILRRYITALTHSRTSKQIRAEHGQKEEEQTPQQTPQPAGDSAFAISEADGGEDAAKEFFRALLLEVKSCLSEMEPSSNKQASVGVASVGGCRNAETMNALVAKQVQRKTKLEIEEYKRNRRKEERALVESLKDELAAAHATSDSLRAVVAALNPASVGALLTKARATVFELREALFCIRYRLRDFRGWVLTEDVYQQTRDLVTVQQRIIASNQAAVPLLRSMISSLGKHTTRHLAAAAPQDFYDETMCWWVDGLRSDQLSESAKTSQSSPPPGRGQRKKKLGRGRIASNKKGSPTPRLSTINNSNRVGDETPRQEANGGIRTPTPSAWRHERERVALGIDDDWAGERPDSADPSLLEVAKGQTGNTLSKRGSTLSINRHSVGGLSRQAAWRNQAKCSSGRNSKVLSQPGSLLQSPSPPVPENLTTVTGVRRPSSKPATSHVQRKPDADIDHALQDLKLDPKNTFPQENVELSKHYKLVAVLLLKYKMTRTSLRQTEIELDAANSELKEVKTELDFARQQQEALKATIDQLGQELSKCQKRKGRSKKRKHSRSMSRSTSSYSRSSMGSRRRKAGSSSFRSFPSSSAVSSSWSSSYSKSSKRKSTSLRKRSRRERGKSIAKSSNRSGSSSGSTDTGSTSTAGNGSKKRGAKKHDKTDDSNGAGKQGAVGTPQLIGLYGGVPRAATDLEGDGRSRKQRSSALKSLHSALAKQRSDRLTARCFLFWLRRCHQQRSKQRVRDTLAAAMLRKMETMSHIPQERTIRSFAEDGTPVQQGENNYAYTVSAAYPPPSVHQAAAQREGCGKLYKFKTSGLMPHPPSDADALDIPDIEWLRSWREIALNNS
ncbi:hypothetical protein DIPPA_31032 [Diplonema papillatum]|nr:hypothetical protein DIPPA_31032 [Diplonema papillatum]